MKFVPFGGWLLNTRYIVGVGPVTQVKKVLEPNAGSVGWEVFVQICHGNDLRTVDAVFTDPEEAMRVHRNLVMILSENLG